MLSLGWFKFLNSGSSSIDLALGVKEGTLFFYLGLLGIILLAQLIIFKNNSHVKQKLIPLKRESFEKDDDEEEVKEISEKKKKNQKKND